MKYTRATIACCTWVALSTASAQDPGLARYFGFDPLQSIVVDDDAGPMLAADMNGDGLMDLVVVNNRKSRIEIHLQREEPLDESALPALSGPNELPPSRFFERVNVSVAHRVGAIAAADMNDDGRLDLLYVGRPSEIVVLAHMDDNEFERLARRRERNLVVSRHALQIADVMGDASPEILALVGGRIHVYPFDGETIGEPIALGSGASDDQFVAVMTEDFDGDGLTDILAVSPEHSLPVRLWLQRESGSTGQQAQREIGAELRFEMPAVRDVKPVRFPDRDSASIAVIERATRRMVLYDLAPPLTSAALATETRPERRSWPGMADRPRAYAVADIDRDGRPDLVATDPAGNRLLLYRQRSGEGLAHPLQFSTFKNPSDITTGQWDDDPSLEVFVLSEDEQTVGVSTWSSGSLSFPQPINLATPGAEPVAIAHIEDVAGEPGLGIVVQDRRDFALEIHTPNGEAATTVELSDMRRAPQTALSADIDGDGASDMLLLTPGEPMTLVLSGDSGRPATVLSSDDMPQFGLVQAAGPNNTALLDVTGDGAQELLIADQNYVRACAFDRERGWRVEWQVAAPDASAALTSIAIFPPGRASRLLGVDGPIVAAADRGAGAVLLFGESSTEGGWSLLRRIELAGDQLGALAAGAFSGDGNVELLSVDGAGFALIRLTGEGATLDVVDAHRADNENRLEHEIAVGDVNSDGFVDLIVLDAREQMCQIYTLSDRRKLHAATEFKVFQTRLFESGEGATYQPSMALIGDFTGDGAADLALLVHDRVLIYPQMTAP